MLLRTNITKYKVNYKKKKKRVEDILEVDYWSRHVCPNVIKIVSQEIKIKNRV